jgi:hypothetical protein
MTTRACSACTCWHRDLRQCRRRPPFTTGWPVTLPTDWCGEYRSPEQPVLRGEDRYGQPESRPVRRPPASTSTANCSFRPRMKGSTKAVRAATEEYLAAEDSFELWKPVPLRTSTLGRGAPTSGPRGSVGQSRPASSSALRSASVRRSWSAASLLIESPALAECDTAAPASTGPTTPRTRDMKARESATCKDVKGTRI